MGAGTAFFIHPAQRVDMARDKHEAEEIEWARKLYASHGIVSQKNDRATLCRPDDTGHYCTEIIQGAQGTLLLHGDTTNIVFRSWRPTKTFKNLVGWVANSDLVYIHEKIVMGVAYRFDPKAAQFDLREHIASFAADSWRNPGTAEALKDFCKDENWQWGTNDEHRLHDAVLEIDEDAHQVFPLGHVPSLNFLSALAACRRLYELL